MRYEIHVNYGDGRGWMMDGEDNTKRGALAKADNLALLLEGPETAKVRVVQYKPTIIASFEVRKRRAKK